MSLIDKIAVGLFLALTITVVAEGLYIRSQKAEKAALIITNQSLTDALSQADDIIALQKESAKITDKVVSDTLQKINDSNVTKDELTEKVNEVARQVANEQIPNSVADATYADSMWAAYCKANKTDSACSTRRTTNSLSH